MNGSNFRGVIIVEDAKCENTKNARLIINYTLFLRFEIKCTRLGPSFRAIFKT